MKNKISIILILILSIICLTSCNKNNSEINKEKLPINKSTNLISKQDIKEIEKVLKASNIDNIDIFKELIVDYYKEDCPKCNLLTKWTDYKKIKYDDIAISDNWEKYHQYSDLNCRMLSFLLLINQLDTKKTIKENGTYLMFDIDAIDNNNKYSIIKANKEKFITIYNEIDVKKYKKEDIKNAYNKKWNDYGISLNNNKVSLINIIMHDNYDDIVFVGHSGILIYYEDKLVFIEKIAFEQPYQVTVFNNKEELKNMLFSRETYFGDKTEEGPFIYENNKLLYEYNK